MDVEKKVKALFEGWAKKKNIEIAGRYEVIYIWDLEDKRPCILLEDKIYVPDASLRELEDVEDVDFFEYSSDDLVYPTCDEILVDMSGKEIEYPLLCDDYEDLVQGYTNVFTVIVPIKVSQKTVFVKVKGSFLSNTVYIPPLYLDDEDVERAVEKWIDKNLNRILEVLSSYGWVAIDLWRGYYEGSDETESFVKVIDGWYGWGSYHPLLELLSDIYNLKKVPPEFPILFVFPRNSNVCAYYYDIYVPQDKKEEFFKHLEEKCKERGIKLEDYFSFVEGVDIHIHA